MEKKPNTNNRKSGKTNQRNTSKSKTTTSRRTISKKNNNIDTKVFALGGLNEIGKNMYCIEHDNELFIIEKAFQHGGEVLRERGIHVESLAIIDSLDNCQIKIR